MSVNKIAIYLIIAIGMVWAYSQGGFFGCIGIAVVGFVGFDFLTQDKSWLPIGELALLLGGIQWIISPFFAYSVSDSIYRMSQPCNVYMTNTVIMYISFMFGFYYFRKSLTLTKSDLINYCKMSAGTSNILILIGVIFLFAPIHIRSLLFLKTLASYLFFIGFIIKMYMVPQKSTLYLLISLGVLFFNSIRIGMFHDLLVWGIFMVMTWFYINQIPLKKRIIILCLSFLGIFLLQTVKSTYRQAIRYNNYSGNKIELFFSLLVDNAVNINKVQSKQESTTIARYNQGWIISRIYNNIPQNHEYFGGKTYIDAVSSALIPRFLYPNKKGAGEQSRKDFIEMTGYNLSSGTSMGLSILGESYGNFGLFGGALFMFFWGCFIANIVTFINKLSIRNFLWIIFLPIICFNLIKAEISMMSVLNWTVKSVIFVLIVIYLLQVLVPQLRYTIISKDKI